MRNLKGKLIHINLNISRTAKNSFFYTFVYINDNMASMANY